MRLNPIKLVFATSLLFLTLLGGCLDKATQVPFLNKILTVEDFTAQPDVRKKVLAFCANDPGELKADPNCINAKQSERMTTSGSGNFPRLDISIPSTRHK